MQPSPAVTRCQRSRQSEFADQVECLGGASTHYSRDRREIGCDSFAGSVEDGVQLPLASTCNRPRQSVLSRGPVGVAIQVVFKGEAFISFPVTSPVDILDNILSCESRGSIHHQVVATHPCDRLDRVLQT